MLEHVESALHDRHASEDRLRHFIADASHELRTPVAVIRSHAEYAQRAGGTAIPAPVTDALSRITAESDRMGHLVDDLLLLARLDSGRELEQVDVDLTRTSSTPSATPEITSPDHRWQPDLPENELHVTGDSRALHQVLANLLTNARTPTPPGTTILTTLSSPAPDTVTVTVTDNGPGIPDDVCHESLIGSCAPTAHAQDPRAVVSDWPSSPPSSPPTTAQAASQAGATKFTVTLPAQRPESAHLRCPDRRTSIMASSRQSAPHRPLCARDSPQAMRADRRRCVFSGADASGWWTQ